MPVSKMARWGAMVAGVVLLTTTAVACASSSEGTGGGSGEPVHGGELTYLVDQAQLTLDPGVSPAEVTGLIDRNIFDSLVVQAGPSSFQPWLATKWTISADGLEYTFDLKTGVKFSDGTPFDAASVKETLDHVVRPETKSQYAASLIAPYKSSTVIDASTIKVTLSKPFRPFLQALSTPFLGIQSPKALAVPATDYKPVGTGPYTFVSWTQQKDVKLTRNPGYASPPSNAPHTGSAYLETLNFNYVAEDTTRYGALTSGQAQGIDGLPPIRVKTVQSNPKLQVLRGEIPGANYSVFFNVKSPLASDLLVRQAFLAAIDMPALVQSIYFGQYATAKNVLAPATADYSPEAEKSLQAYDPAKARQLLDQAGWTSTNADGYRTKDGKELKLTWPSFALLNKDQRDVLGQGIQAKAKEAGIRVERPNLDEGGYTDAVLNGGYDLLDVSNTRADPDILRFAFASDATFAKGGANISLASSPELDGWINEGAATSDQAVAKTDYAAAQAYVLKNAYVLPAYVAPYLVGASANLRGVIFDAQGFPQFYGAWLSR